MPQFEERKPSISCCSTARSTIHWMKPDDSRGPDKLGWAIGLHESLAVYYENISFCPFCGQTITEGAQRNTSKDDIVLAYASLLHENEQLTARRNSAVQRIEELRRKLYEEQGLLLGGPNDNFLIETAAKVAREGPIRVMYTDQGDAMPYPAYKKQFPGKELDIIFVRKDGWTLGTFKELESVAHNHWADAWVAVFKVVKDTKSKDKRYGVVTYKEYLKEKL
jgi:hypothetical protein